MLILALLSQLVGALAASLIVVRGLKSPCERLLTHLPPAGAASARRWLLGALIAVGVTSGIHLGLGSGAFGGPVWPFFGPGTPHLDQSLVAIAGVEAFSGAISALRGLAFATLFLLGLSILGGILAGRERSTGIGRLAGEGSRRGGRDRGREMPPGPRPGPRIEDPRDRSGEPRRMPLGGGRGRGPAPGRGERREGREGREGREREGRGEGREREGRDRESREPQSRESYREPVGSTAPRGGPGFAGPRHGARPIPDPPAVVPTAAGAPIAADRGLPGREPRDGRR